MAIVCDHVDDIEPSEASMTVLTSLRSLTPLHVDPLLLNFDYLYEISYLDEDEE